MEVETSTREITRSGEADAERQIPGSEQQDNQDGEPTWVLIINGHHVFCYTPLYSTPFALRQGGWVGIFLLMVYWFCALFTSWELGRCMMGYPSVLANYQEIGRVAYGTTGRIVVFVTEHLVVLAGCVESVTIVCQAVVYGLPQFITFLGHRSKWTIIIGVIVMIIPVTFVCEKMNVRRNDRWLNVLGSILDLLVVACLFWLHYINGVTENIPTTEYVILFGLPTASGLFGYCFAGHPYLPILYYSIRTPDRRFKYYGILICFFCTSLFSYANAAILGYSMFGENVKPVYILNMPLQYPASVVAIIAMVIHQVIRFSMGVDAMVESLYNLFRLNRFGNENNYSRVILRCAIVTLIVPLTILMPAYGPLMAFLGSFLGIVVSLIIPCACTLRIRRLQLSKPEFKVLIMIILLGAFAAIAGMVSSFPQLNEMQWGDFKFSE